MTNIKPGIAVVLANIVSTFFGVGYTGFIKGRGQGTVASFVAMVVLFLLHRKINTYTEAGILVVFIIIAIITSGITEKFYGVKDDPRVVIDEVVGCLVTMFLLPKSIIFLTAGFILFRVFDILKPFPAKLSQNLSGGIGIVVDDIIAGIYANVVIYISAYAIMLLYK
ncbi:MAG: phosphatidylglycerophosphatase A [Elusimicrobiota bacterium]